MKEDFSVRKKLLLLIALLTALALVLTGCTPAGGGLKEKIVGKYTSDLFGSMLDLTSMTELFGITPEGDTTAYAEFTADGKIRPLIGDKDVATYFADLLKDLDDSMKESASTLTAMAGDISFTYTVKDEKTITMGMGDEKQDLAVSWNGDVMTLTDSTGTTITFTKVK